MICNHKERFYRFVAYHPSLVSIGKRKITARCFIALRTVNNVSYYTNCMAEIATIIHLCVHYLLTSPNSTNAPFVLLKPFNINRHLLSFLFSIVYSTISIVDVSYKKIETIALIMYWNLSSCTKYDVVHIFIKQIRKNVDLYLDHWDITNFVLHYA